MLTFPPPHSDQYFGNHTYSQHFEDGMILNLFRQLGIHKPSYLDLGAHHPIHISNTALLYERGSCGVNVEANAYLIASFKKERPRDINIQSAVSATGGPLTFFMFDDWCGLNTCSYLDAMKFKSQSGRKIERQIEVESKTVNEIVEQYCDDKFPQFLNCDLEGLDYDILKAADFSKSQPLIICVETRFDETEKMTEMMLHKGFKPYCRCGENILYVYDHSFEVLQSKLKSNTYA